LLLEVWMGLPGLRPEWKSRQAQLQPAVSVVRVWLTWIASPVVTVFVGKVAV
jgi:hypothetical protein